MTLMPSGDLAWIIVCSYWLRSTGDQLNFQALDRSHLIALNEQVPV
jgi:hypothetical protein